MNRINVDILTNYFCNFRCEYCFLYNLKNIERIIDINKLQQQLDSLSEKYIIDDINLYGGEISMLPLHYLKQLIDLCGKYAQVNVITNFTNQKCNDFLQQSNVTVSTSINEERTYNQQVESSLLLNDNNNLSLIQVVTPSILGKSPKEILDHLELFKRDVGFLQYSPAKEAKMNYQILNKDFSFFIRRIITEYLSGDYSFNISNISQLNNVLENKYDPRMHSILFITPFNKYASLGYENQLEYFKIFNTIEDWELVCKEESIVYKQKCDKCKYYGRCYAEHLKEWRKDDECCGMKSLIEWYEKNIYQNNRGLSASL